MVYREAEDILTSTTQIIVTTYSIKLSLKLVVPNRLWMIAKLVLLVKEIFLRLQIRLNCYLILLLSLNI